VDWGKHNILAVALRNAVYLWNEATGQITQLMELNGADEFVSSVSWIQEGQILAVGNSNGAVQLWDCNQIKQVTADSQKLHFSNKIFCSFTCIYFLLSVTTVKEYH
jgi:WD40 repeat protein